MADQYWLSPVTPFRSAAGSSFGTFTTLQDVSPTPLPSMPGGQLRVGSMFELEAWGEVSSTATPNLILGFYYGTASSVALAVSNTLAIATGAAWPWHLKWMGLVTATGASGTVVGQGIVDIGTSLTAQTGAPIPITQALRTVTIDTTVAKNLGVCASWSASSASNTVKTNFFTANLLN